ncbi:aminomethyl-transferring glycine dehydrogenase subunit GcvPA [Thermomicrobiaceae bacterium CFH 74404]|uniref:Probable glycine dehydrogenase (decarboxylating) subunit 1 n=1 Tax=Thermalbibacter longus TaxID=2951981 RepID=A0AA42BAP0_9BACT|nr:aminomethyl-transferring glycine dehydrogenase subunit GcvPA [Thermalbibacter longus]MCM8750061.1 aminomethyl-transferring glycine dehydrogenase subunit GcvPA [Thermalbibacter longus]
MTFSPHTPEDRKAMLEAIGVSSVAELFEVVPEEHRFPSLDLPPRLSEADAYRELVRLAERNVNASTAATFLGAGSYNHYVPATVQQILWRGEFYTAYTPYQPEVAQGTLQAIYEFQSSICLLTGMEVSNASLYDGATALAEGALLSVSLPRQRTKIVVAGTVHPYYRSVLQTYTRGLLVTVEELPLPHETLLTTPEMVAPYLDERTACLVVQYPNFFGRIEDIAAFAEMAHQAGSRLLVSVYPIALGLLKAPGELGADIVTGEGQSLGIPQSFGGPVLGLLATKRELVRQLPGRLIGMTQDSEGKRGFVMVLQTREQHIRREKATSNICTNQGLMSLAATVYLSSLGKQGLRRVAELCYHKAHYLAERIAALDRWEVVGAGPFFNEFAVRTPIAPEEVNRRLLDEGIIGGYPLNQVDPRLSDLMLVCATEQNTREQIDHFVSALASMA